MNEFFLASNRTELIEIDEDYSVEVRQLLVHEIDNVERFAGPIRNALKDQWEINDLHCVIENNQIVVMLLMSTLSTLKISNLSQLKDDAPEKFIEIFLMILRLNESFFKKNKDKNKKSDTSSTWFDSFHYLIKHGHSHNDILNYSYGTFIEYIKAAQRLEKTSLLNTSNSVRVSYHADKKGFESYTKGLKN